MVLSHGDLLLERPERYGRRRAEIALDFHRVVIGGFRFERFPQDERGKRPLGRQPDPGVARFTDGWGSVLD